MPRECGISVEDVVDTIIKFYDHFKIRLPPYSDKVWDEISLTCKGAWSKKSWHTNITYNRRNVMTLALQKMGIKDSSRNSQCCHDMDKSESLNITQSTETSLEELNSSTSSQENNSFNNSLFTSSADEQIFNLYLSPAEWSEIQPVETGSFKRSNNTLRPDVWTNVIAVAFWKQHKLPCAFSFKSAQVNQSSRRKFYLKIRGKCRSQKCGNRFIGISFKEPKKNEEFLIYVKTRNTTFDDHENLSRYLNGNLRKKIGKKCVAEGSSNVQKKLIKENLSRGDLAQPIIPSLSALQHARCEKINNDLGMKKGDKSNPIEALLKLQYDNNFLGSIQDICCSPFYVMYGTSEQVAVYQKYCRTLGNSSTISIDATGSLVKKLDKPNDTKSAHIFLYCIVINFHGTILSVYQMLSEAQDSDTILLWLNRFLRRTNKKPREVVTDYSRALLSAVSLAFNKVSLNIYVEQCFMNIMGKDNIFYENFPLTYVRIDVAHLIHLVCKWKCWQKVQQIKVRDFFLRCVSLLVESHTIEDFEVILQLTLIIAFQLCIDTTVKINEDFITVQQAYKKLQNSIADRKIKIDHFVDGKILNPDEADDKTNDEDDKDFIESEVPVTSINSYIDRIMNNAKKIIEEGEEINGHYCPEFGNNLIRLSREFPLWTAVTTSYFANHASSSSAEANFGDLKTSVLKNYKKNLKVDKFIRIHLSDLIGGTRKFDHNITNFIQKRCRPLSPEMKHSQKRIKKQEAVNLQENWKNKAEIPIFHDMKQLESDDDDEKQEFMSNDDEDYDNEDNDEQLKLGLNNSNGINKYKEVQQPVANDVDGDCNEWNIDTPNQPELNFDNGDNDDDYYKKSKELTSNDDKSMKTCEKSSNNDNKSLETYEISDDDDDGDDDNQCSESSKNFVLPLKNNVGENRQQQLVKEKKSSKYFSDHPEIRLCSLQLSARKTEKKIFMRNGGLRIEGLKSKELKLPTLIHNTCAFDSIAHIIATAAIDDTAYLSSIKQHSSEIPMFNFINSLTEFGATLAVEKERGKLLFSLYKNTLHLNTVGDITISQSIDCWDSSRNLWVLLFKNSPSAVRTVSCKNQNCLKSRTFEYTTISPHNEVIINEGFSNLESAITIRQSESIHCEKCGGKVKEEVVLNNQIYIELDIRRIDKSHKISEQGETCQIAEIPKTLCIENYTYRLAGIVAFTPGHFIAYCLRTYGSWEMFNDMNKSKVPASERRRIEPHGLIYINFDDKN